MLFSEVDSPRLILCTSFLVDLSIITNGRCHGTGHWFRSASKVCSKTNSPLPVPVSYTCLCPGMMYDLYYAGDY